MQTKEEIIKDYSDLLKENKVLRELLDAKEKEIRTWKSTCELLQSQIRVDQQTIAGCQILIDKFIKPCGKHMQKEER